MKSVPLSDLNLMHRFHETDHLSGIFFARLRGVAWFGDWRNESLHHGSKLGARGEKRLRRKVGRAATSSSKELYLVSQDNVIKMARHVTVWKARHWFEAGLCQYRLCMSH
jgi:hypothetical protein